MPIFPSFLAWGLDDVAVLDAWGYERITRGRGAPDTILQRRHEQYRISLLRATEFFGLQD